VAQKKFKKFNWKFGDFFFRKKDIVMEYFLLFCFMHFGRDFATPKKMLMQGQGHKNSVPSHDYSVSQ
jgi:hypothetical protein